MSDVYLQILSHLTGIWRRRWYVIAISWLVCGLGWTMVASLPDRYESQARVYVDMDTMLGPLMRGLAVEMNLFEQIDVMQRTLLSRPNMEKIILMTDLDYRVNSPEEKEELINAMQKRISVRQQGRNLFRVTFEDSDPHLAKRVVQAVLQIFVEGNLGANRKDMDTTRRFLERQIRDYERQLETSEGKLARFKRENLGMLPGDGNYHSHMQSVHNQLGSARAMMAEAEQVKSVLEQQLAEVPQYVETVDVNSQFALASAQDNGPESDIQVRIFELQSIIDNLMLRYTERHPDVQAAKKRMADLMKQLEGGDMAGPPGGKGAMEGPMEGPANGPMESAADGGPAMGPADGPGAAIGAGLDGAAELNMAAGGGPGLGPVGPGPSADAPPQPPEPPKNRAPNPLYEKIKLRLVQQEAAIAALQRRVIQKETEAQKWQKLARTVPQVEAELTRLNRDYEIVKRGYEELRRRQESARLASDLETKAQKIQFRIIDPPRIPLSPSGPNRPMFLSVVLVGGVVAGLAFAFLLGQINGAFTTVQGLRNSFAVPVLGSVSAIMSPHEKRRRWREMLSFGMVCLGLAMAFGGLLTVEVLLKA